MNPERALLRVSLVAYMLLLAYLSLAPIVLPEYGFDPKKLFLHFIAYFILGMLLLLSTQHLKTSYTAGIAYGAVLEVIQAFLPARYFDFFDLTTNVLGVIVGVLIAKRMKR